MSYSSLEITTLIGCSNNCRVCPQGNLTAALHDIVGPTMLQFDIFRKLLSTVPQHVRIDFSGFCEPLLNVNATQMMSHAYRSNYRVALYTTLVGLREVDCHIMATMHFDHIVVHIPDKYDFMYDTEQWIKQYRMFESMGKSARYMSFGEVDERIQSELSHANTTIERPTLLSRGGNLRDIHVQHKSGPLLCGSGGDRHNVVLPNGDVYLCCMDWSLKHKLGNLLTDSYESISSGPRVTEIAQLRVEQDNDLLCRNCEWARIL